MQDRELYARILGLSDPWRVVDVQLDMSCGEVVVRVEPKSSSSLACPSCGQASGRYDSRERRWRHLDTCQYKTILVADIPRIQCSEHGVLQVHLPWAEPGSRFTALFEAVVIDWLRSLATIKAVAEQLRLTWDEVDGIMARAVERGLRRRKDEPVRHLGIDETSFQKRHEYVTVIADVARSRVLHVGDGRGRDVVDAFFEGRSQNDLATIESVAMDMWKPYIASTRDHVPDADRKIAFDKFHVAKHLGDAVDQVRRQEHRQLSAIGDDTLKGSRFVWLMNPENLSAATSNALDVLRKLSLKTARAWSFKETAMSLWRYVRRSRALQAWNSWLSWAMRSRLEPIKRVAKMIRTHLFGIVNAMTLQVTNATSESFNSTIQRIKRAACGFRNRDRFRNAILFHLGGLDLYPGELSATHTKA